MRGGGKIKPGKLTDVLGSLTVEYLDQELVKIGREWIRHYKIRQMLAEEEGITTPPPLPPQVLEEARALPESESGLSNVNALIDRYVADPNSPYQKVRHSTRMNYDSMLKAIRKSCGSWKLVDMRADDFNSLNKEWTEERGPTAGHGLITMKRMLLTFGAQTLKDRECERLSGVLHSLRIRAVERRQPERATNEQIASTINAARELGYSIVALGQAFKFDCELEQKDVCGEWVPKGVEDGPNDFTNPMTGAKWMRGLLWSEIDDNFVLRHMPSRGKKLRVIELRTKPMVMRELSLFAKVPEANLTRAHLPKNGAIVTDPVTNRPYHISKYRELWREAIAALKGQPSSDTLAEVHQEDLAPGTRH
jgi:hypothetical protein